MRSCLWIFFAALSAGSSSFGQNSDAADYSRLFNNQIGYLPSAPKIALVSSPTGLPFEIIDAEADRSVLKGMLELAEPENQAGGADLWLADFSIVKATGNYILSVEGIGKSDPFQIDDRIYAPLASRALSVFTLHRSGIALPKILAGNWGRDASHIHDGFLFSEAPGNPQIHPATGGWFDGSDYGKYVVKGNYAAGMLLTLYEFFPQAFPDGSLMAPERGNGAPDLLDEVRWQLEFVLRMQNDQGAFYHKVTSLNPISPIPPEKDESERFVFPPSTAATAGACALLAKASRLYSPLDATFAAACRQSAQRGWNFLTAHAQNIEFENPPNVHTKNYRDIDDADERFWAAVELYLATNDPVYQTGAIAIERKRIPLLSAAGYWGNVMPLAIASLLKAEPDSFDKELREAAVKDLLSLADILVEKTRSNGFQLSLREEDFSWGSNGALLQNAFILCLAHTHSQKRAYKLAALDQLHAVLGRNPLSICYVTGFGRRSPKRPYHFISMTDKFDDPVPGLLVAGPNPTLGDSAVKKAFSSGAAPATIYLDSEESLSTNDADLTRNAALAFIASYFSFE
ncbi:MAG: glycoside hydrolase family 9 protein [Candidatus Omnitrophica bacterium]|nr:glycoside hydrolase family 9 protein [Candidatus Omnitrophota bacterium]